MERFKVACASCGFACDDAADLLVHMLEAGHGLPPSLREKIGESGLFAEFARMIDIIRTGQPLPAGAELRRLDDDDPALSDEIRARMQERRAEADTTRAFCIEHKTKPFDATGDVFKTDQGSVLRLSLHHRDVPVPCRYRDIPLPPQPPTDPVAFVRVIIDAALDELIAEEEGAHGTGRYD